MQITLEELRESTKK